MEKDVFELYGENEIKSFLEDSVNQVFYINKKTTRIGATTGYTKFLSNYAKTNGKRLLILEPTNAIIEGTVITACPDIYWLRKNADLCLRADVKSRKRQFIDVFGYLPFDKATCDKCSYNNTCERNKIEDELSKHNLIATTYAKVYFDKKMLAKLNPDIILMDEFQWIDKFEVNRFTEKDLSNILGDFNYSR